MEGVNAKSGLVVSKVVGSSEDVGLIPFLSRIFGLKIIDMWASFLLKNN